MSKPNTHTMEIVYPLMQIEKVNLSVNSLHSNPSKWHKIEAYMVRYCINFVRWTSILL